MEWIKKGLIYVPDGKQNWNNNSFMTPSPILLNDTTIRLYGGVRDAEGRSRISYIDVDSKNPQRIIKVSNVPVLDLGREGCFDDNGMILGDVIKVQDKIYMYYVGFQLVNKVKFLAFSGLAISEDFGETFTRYSESPIMDRTNNARYIRAIHTVIFDSKEEKFKIWYAIGNRWEVINDKQYPSYDIWYTESKDGINISNVDDCCCIKNQDSEYRIGRPKVYKTPKGYEMFYTRDFIPKDYVIGYATSIDGKNWIRKDHLAGISKENKQDHWDSEMACYPALINCNDKVYMFYNGNGMGYSGVGHAEKA